MLEIKKAIFCLVFSRIKKTLRLLLTSDDGYLYIYGLDVHEGGDCHLIRQFHLTNTSNTGITESELAHQVVRQLILSDKIAAYIYIILNRFLGRYPVLNSSEFQHIFNFVGAATPRSHWNSRR